MANAMCMSEDGNQATFIGTFIPGGENVRLCDDCMPNFCAAVFQRMTGVDMEPAIAMWSQGVGAVDELQVGEPQEVAYPPNMGTPPTSDVDPTGDASGPSGEDPADPTDATSPAGSDAPANAGAPGSGTAGGEAESPPEGEDAAHAEAA